MPAAERIIVQNVKDKNGHNRPGYQNNHPALTKAGISGI